MSVSSLQLPCCGTCNLEKRVHKYIVSSSLSRRTLKVLANINQTVVSFWITVELCGCIRLHKLIKFIVGFVLFMRFADIKNNTEEHQSYLRK